MTAGMVTFKALYCETTTGSLNRFGESTKNAVGISTFEATFEPRSSQLSAYRE
jgi:hypothetical protein